jgi:serine kinase of HPr protein (carbohydrate metabolism regulator)
MTIHASAVLVGARAVLIRGPSGAGKSRLAFGLIEAARTGRLPFARLVADDRTAIAPCHGRLLLRPAESLAGLIEIRGIGVCRMPYEPVAVAGLVVDLNAPDSDRLPSDNASQIVIETVRLSRLAVAEGADPVSTLLIALKIQHGLISRAR